MAANYAGNDEAASKFTRETGIAVFKFDVADFQVCKAGIKRIERALGPIDILVNNAGVTRDAMLHKMTPVQWQEVIAVDLGSCFNTCRLVIEGMRERGFGRIVNISSINGQKGQFGQTNYAAAKAGMLGFTKALALETASKGITVNAVAPGHVATDMVAAVAPNVVAGIVSQIPVGDSAMTRKSRMSCAFSSRTAPPSSPAPPSRRTAANTWLDRCQKPRRRLR